VTKHVEEFKAGNRRSDFGRADRCHDVARKCPHGRTLVETAVVTAVDLLGQACLVPQKILHTLFCLTASKQSDSFTCELFHCQPWTDVSKRSSVPLKSRGEIMTRVDLRAAAGRDECHVFCYF
jgi:hypothetical protein